MKIKYLIFNKETMKKYIEDTFNQFNVSEYTLNIAVYYNGKVEYINIEKRIFEVLSSESKLEAELKYEMFEKFYGDKYKIYCTSIIGSL